MGSRIDELEESINDLKAEIGVEGSPSSSAPPKIQEEHKSAGWFCISFSWAPTVGLNQLVCFACLSLFSDFEWKCIVVPFEPLSRLMFHGSINMSNVIYSFLLLCCWILCPNCPFGCLNMWVRGTYISSTSNQWSTTQIQVLKGQITLYIY